MLLTANTVTATLAVCARASLMVRSAEQWRAKEPSQARGASYSASGPVSITRSPGGTEVHRLPKWASFGRRQTTGRHAMQPTTRPNFVFILADDLGYADLHCYGGRAECSPNLDRM